MKRGSLDAEAESRDTRRQHEITWRLGRKLSRAAVSAEYSYPAGRGTGNVQFRSRDGKRLPLAASGMPSVDARADSWVATAEAPAGSRQQRPQLGRDSRGPASALRVGSGTLVDGSCLASPLRVGSGAGV
eukprot:scaffold34921_cov236-Isochrysis_galbana.AAC.1